MVKTNLQELETRLEAELRSLGPLLDPPPLAADAMARLRTATRDACRAHRRQRLLRSATTFAAAAAAALLALVLPSTPGPASFGETEVLDAWVAAATDSSATFTILYESPVLDEASTLFDEHDGEVSLEIIDQSLQALDGAFGA